jgi:hypothetical protein
VRGQPYAVREVVDARRNVQVMSLDEFRAVLRHAVVPPR